MRLLLLILVAVAGVVCASAPRAQELRGMVDLEQSIEKQIYRLEQLVGGDLAALNQVIALQWLIELYSLSDRYGDVESCYTRILVFFPNDVGTLNSYGRFLMARGNYQRARDILYDAHEWARATDTRSIDLGTTYQLRSEVMRRLGEYETSVRMADSALRLMGPERSMDALHTKARSQLALELYDDAADTYLRLIAVELGANSERINALKLFVAKTTKYSAGSVQEIVDDAVEKQRLQNGARIELEGGTLVTLNTSDGAVLEGTFRDANGPGAVLFVHDARGQRSVFTPYAQLLRIDNISSLALDLRGHGGSRADSMLSYDALSAPNRSRLSDDIVAAFRYLQETLNLDDERIAVVAAGSACAIVEKALYRGRIDAPVVHLSPTFPATDRELHTAMSFHADNPALIISAREDISSMRSIQAFTDSKKRAQLETRFYKNAGHGVETLRRVPDALEKLQEWLRAVVGTG